VIIVFPIADINQEADKKHNRYSMSFIDSKDQIILGIDNSQEDLYTVDVLRNI
jgi:hypothetical protein